VVVLLVRRLDGRDRVRTGVDQGRAAATGRHRAGAVGHVAVGQRRAVLDDQDLLALQVDGALQRDLGLALDQLRVRVQLGVRLADDRQLLGVAESTLLTTMTSAIRKLVAPGVVRALVAGAAGRRRR